MKAATTGGSSLSEKAESIGSILGMLGRTQKEERQAAADPVARQRQRLSISDAERDDLERSVDDEVQRAVTASLRSLEAGA